MSDQRAVPADEDPGDDEYGELVQLIVNAEWLPGDIVRTSKGATWQFRAAPYTSDFPMNDQHASETARKGAVRSPAS